MKRLIFVNLILMIITLVVGCTNQPGDDHDARFQSHNVRDTHGNQMDNMPRD